MKRCACLLVLLAAIPGCGGGKAITDRLFALSPTTRWVYKFTGNVTLPASKGGGTQGVQAGSTITFEGVAGHKDDANGTTVDIAERVYDLTLLDSRTVPGVQRIYYTQGDSGIFMHGFNNSATDTITDTNDKFVPSSAGLGFKYLYLPDPALNGQSASYANPYTLTGMLTSYSVALGSVRSEVTVPKGKYLAKSITLEEEFSKFKITSGAFVPDVGIVGANIDTTLPDGTKIVGTIQLIEYTK